MIHVNDLEEVLDIMIEALDDEDSANFVADQNTIRTMIQLSNFNTDFVPDIIEFNSEEEGYYYFSFDVSEDDEITYSVYSATDIDGNFIGMMGLLLVDEDVPQCFESDVNYWNEDVRPVRVIFESEDDEDCNGNCEDCCLNENNYIDVEFDENDSVVGFNASWEREDNSQYTFSFHSSDEDEVLEMIKLFKDL